MGDNLAIVDLTDDNVSSNRRTTRYFDLARNTDRQTNLRTEPIDLTTDDNQYLNSNIPVIDLTSDNDQFANYRTPVIDLTDDDVMDITDQIQGIDLTDDNISSNRRITRYFDLAGNIDTQTNRRTELIDLIKDDNQYLNSNIPAIDLTSDNDQFANYRTPVIDLTDDDAMNITDKIQCIDLTDNSSNNSHTNGYFDLARNDDRYTNRSTELTDLTEHGNEYFNPDAPGVDLTCDNDEFANYKMSVVDRTHDDVQDVTHHLQCVSLTEGKQQCSINDCITTTDLTYSNDQSIDQTIPAIHLTSRGGYENNRFDVTCDNTDNIAPNVQVSNLTDHFIPAIDFIRNDTVVREPVDDTDVRSYKNMPNNSQKSVSGNNPRIPVKNPNYKATEYNILKCDETSNMNRMHIDASSGIQQQQPRKEIILTHHPLTNNFEVKDLSPGKYEKISQNNISDLLKPARHPIPFRHSLGRSTVNTSKNVPIEYTEASEGGFRTMTVSSTFRRKKSKSSSVISNHNLSNSSELSTSRADAFSFGAFKEFLKKFCIVFIFLLIFLIFLWYFTGF